VEPRGRWRPARLRLDLRRHARLDLTRPQWQRSLPTLNWLRVDEPEAAPTLPAILAAAADASFEAVGLDMVTVARFLRDDRRLDDVTGLLHRCGLACTDVGVLVADAARAEDDAARLAELAAATGAGLCITVLDARPSPASLALLRRCSDALAEAGARLALEFVAYTGVPTVQDALDVCAEVGWERCGVLLDSWHFFRGGGPWEQLRSLTGEQLALVHVNDGGPPEPDPVLESRHRRLPAGRGAFPLDKLADQLAELGYAGAVSAEVLSDELRGLPLAAAARKLMASLETFRSQARS
jgi:sugar phosphate isomerase/epimerase